MAYDPATYKVNLDTPQPDGRKGESPRNAFTKYNALVEALKNAPPAPSSTTTNKIPQWSNTVGGLKDGLGLSTSSTLAGNSDSNVPSEKAVKAYVDSQTDLIVSSGSNANGRWTQFADGTQICYLVKSFASNGANTPLETFWTFPKSFKDVLYAPLCVLSTNELVGTYSGVGGPLNESGITLITQKTTSTDHVIKALTIGRWK